MIIFYILYSSGGSSITWFAKMRVILSRLRSLPFEWAVCACAGQHTMTHIEKEKERRLHYNYLNSSHSHCTFYVCSWCKFTTRTHDLSISGHSVPRSPIQQSSWSDVNDSSINPLSARIRGLQRIRNRPCMRIVWEWEIALASICHLL